MDSNFEALQHKAVTEVLVVVDDSCLTLNAEILSPDTATSCSEAQPSIENLQASVTGGLTRKGSTSSPSLVTNEPRSDLDLSAVNTAADAPTCKDVTVEEEDVDILEEKLRVVGNMLQKGLLSKTVDSKAEEVKLMSSYLHQLECTNKPDMILLKSSGIVDVLNRISHSSDLQQDCSHNLIGRAKQILDKWDANAETTDLTTLSEITTTSSPVNGVSTPSIDTTTSCVTNITMPSTADSNTEAAVSHSDQLALLGTIDQSKQPSNTHALQSAAPLTDHSPSRTQPTSPHSQQIPKLVRIEIDLTGDDDRGKATGSNTALGGSLDAESIALRGKKRKFPGAKEERKASNQVKRLRSPRKTSVLKHYRSENLWINDATTFIMNEIIQAKSEIVQQREKRDRVVAELDVELCRARERKERLVEHRKHLLAWGAQDDEVTEEWSR